MPYDVTTILVRPGVTPRALPKIGEWLRAHPSKSELLACWFTELGALNKILIIRAFGDEAALTAERDQLARDPDPFAVGEFSTSIEMDQYVSFPFMEPMRPGRVAPLFEVRTYQLKPDGLAPTIELWRKAVPGRATLSPLLAAMYTVSGGVPRFMHIWPYASLNERQELRAKAVEIGVWPPPGGPSHLLAQQADIYLPTEFSPIR